MTTAATLPADVTDVHFFKTLRQVSDQIVGIF